MAVGEPVGSDVGICGPHPPKHRAMRNAREAQPGRQGLDRTGAFRGATPDLDQPPTGLAVDGEEGAIRENLDKAAPVLGLLGNAIEPNDLAAAQAGKAEKQDGPVPEAAQVEGEGGPHRQ